MEWRDPPGARREETSVRPGAVIPVTDGFAEPGQAPTEVGAGGGV